MNNYKRTGVYLKNEASWTVINKLLDIYNRAYDDHLNGEKLREMAREKLANVVHGLALGCELPDTGRRYFLLQDGEFALPVNQLAEGVWG